MESKYQRTKQIICFIFCFVLLLSLISFDSTARERELKTIRVGFFEFDGYHMIDKDNNRSGYGYEFLQHMAGYTDWNYEYVGYDKSWSEMQEMLANGEIDILTSAQKTEERIARFDFSDEPIGTSSAILTVRAGDSKYSLADYQNWNGMRVGMIKNSSRNDDFADFAYEHGFSYTPVYYDDTDAIVAALKKHTKIDAILTSNLRSINDEWILEKFSSSPFYIMVKKGNDELLSEINNTLGMLAIDEPELHTKLMNKYYTPNSGDQIAFTATERKYIEAMRDETFTASINPDRAPYSYFTSEGEPVGIINDILNMTAKRSNLNIKLIISKDREEYRNAIQSGETDIHFDACYDYADEEALGYRLTVPYLDASVSKLYRKKTKKFSSVALLKDSYLTKKYIDYISSQYSNITYYDTIDKVTDAVKSGKQDVAFLYTASASLSVQNDITNQLTAEIVYGYNNSFAIAVNEKQNQLLFSILNKTILSINQNEIQEIVQKHTTYTKKPFSLLNYVYDNPFIIVAVIAFLFLVIALITITVFQSQKRKLEYKQLLEEKQRNELLADALTAAENANAAKNQFLSSVSHEMRTPLNAIIGFLSLAKGSEAQQTENYLANSEIAAKQLLSVINDVLDMSSIESGKMKLSLAPFDLKHTIDDITSMFASQCREKGLEFKTDLIGSIDDWLVGDQLRLSQILMNLLSNAVKFTDRGHVYLAIKQINTRENKVFIRFEISDTGCGMAAEMQKRLFKPFEQESAETTRKYGGSGLGLSIVKSLVTMMNGAISVKSHQNEGSTFIVNLPFAKSAATHDLQSSDKNDVYAAVTAHESHSDYDFAGKRVLLAEDNAMNRMVAEGLITRGGIECDSAEDGQIVADKFMISAPGHYDAILMDIQMPNVGGFEATQMIRESSHPDANVIPIIALTANAFNEDIAKTLSAGMNYHITKPIDPDLLFFTLDKAFKKKSE